MEISGSTSGYEFFHNLHISFGKKKKSHVISIFPKRCSTRSFADLFSSIDEGKQKYVKSNPGKAFTTGIDLSMEEGDGGKKRSTGYIGRFHIASFNGRIGLWKDC